MSEYRKLARQPLVFALAEFRFSPVLQIEEYIPKFQEALRNKYPLPETLQEQSVQINAGGFAISAKMRWAFISADRHSAVSLDQERLIFFTTAYPRFEGFAESCLSALAPLRDVVKPDLLMRVGLRYGDLVRIGEDEKLEDYVDPYFGYPKLAEPLGEPLHQRDEVVIRTKIGRLKIRSLYGHSELVCMPDLQGISILPKADSEPSERILLDFDHIWFGEESPQTFDLDRIEDILGKLHETARKAFWRITTDDAKDNKWN
ncbi:MAG: TIGR04255 family protein [Woeseia sp.]